MGRLGGVEAVPTEQLPAGLAAALRPELADLGDEIIAAISTQVPPYARPLEGSFGRGVRRRVQEALRRFLEVIEGRVPGVRDPAWESGREVYVELGRGEVRQGRPLDALLAAYRVGARVAWRRLAVVATDEVGLGPDGLIVLAEAVFAYIDELSAASAEGYALEQSEAAGERERRRDRLAGLLLDGAEAVVLEDAARAAGWRPPETLAAVVAPLEAAPALAVRFGPEALRVVRADAAWVLVPDPDGPGRRAVLERALAGQAAVVGPAVPWLSAAASAGRAELARTVQAAGRLPATGDPLFADDHLATLVLARDPGLMADLAARRLAPLSGLPAPTRERLAATLLSWLGLRGERARVAAALHVHPQTVRYRLGQLRALFGAALDDPTARFELELVLRAGHT